MAGNPLKGEVEFESGGNTYTLVYSIDAICTMEAALGKGFPAIAADMADINRMSLLMVRQVLHSGLLERHPDLTLKQAGELILPAGGAIKIMAKITEALGSAFPEAKAVPPGPPRGPRRTGTGRPS